MLDPVLLNAIGDLELVARVTVDGTLSGMHRSPFHGYSAEFSQYRHYRPGDDLKYVDWKLLARTDRVYTKQFRETTNLRAQIAVDASRSMSYRAGAGVSKLDYARLLAAALAHILAGQGDGIGLLIYDESLRRHIPSRTGQPHLHTLFVALAQMRAEGGATTAAPAIRRAVDLLERRGLLILISDLYDESEEVDRELRRTMRIGHEAAIFHVLTRDEIEFPFEQDVQLEDLETGRVLPAGSPASAQSYREQVADFLERWRTRCAAAGIDYTRVTTDTPLDAALRGYLLRRAERIAG
ncbi:MAG TPA: DUF58 domain-containing protein [Vicinamibacterales bacterium]|nr:DUF58 domain-containing protein [Vicinamibacterales bacterium]